MSLLWWSGQGVFLWLCKHGPSGLILSCMTTTNKGLLTSSVWAEQKSCLALRKTCNKGWQPCTVSLENDCDITEVWVQHRVVIGIREAEKEAKSPLMNLSGIVCIFRLLRLLIWLGTSRTGRRSFPQHVLTWWWNMGTASPHSCVFRCHWAASFFALPQSPALYFSIGRNLLAHPSLSEKSLLPTTHTTLIKPLIHTSQTSFFSFFKWAF